MLARIPDGFVAELTYGADVDWYRNVTAAGRCVVVKHGVEYAVDHIESCSTEDGLAAFGSLRSLVLRALRRHEFRRLHVEPAAVAVTAVRAAPDRRRHPTDGRRRGRPGCMPAPTGTASAAHSRCC